MAEIESWHSLFIFTGSTRLAVVCIRRRRPRFSDRKAHIADFAWIDMGAPVTSSDRAPPGRNKCTRARARQAFGRTGSNSMASIRCLGRATALLGLGLSLVDTAAASAWLGAGRGRSAAAPLSFGYALPSRSAYSPPSFYPRNAPPPPEETHFQDAVEAARQSRARRMERHPAFPETPAALAHEISGGDDGHELGKSGLVVLVGCGGADVNTYTRTK